jgi:hypothetical protein
VKQLVATALLTQPSHSLSAENRPRAQQAFNLCRLLGHPSDQALISLLGNGNMIGTALTSQDLRTARHLFGPCPACVEGKMQAPSLPSSLTPPATKIGERLHIDFIILSHESLKAALDTFNSRNHRVQHITSDDERVMKAATLYLASRGISITTTPAQFDEKRIERHIQTLKAKKRSIEASLSYVLPAQLEAEVSNSLVESHAKWQYHRHHSTSISHGI